MAFDIRHGQVRVVPDDDPKCDAMICMPYDGVLLVPDNVLGQCVSCEHQVQCRPTVPAELAKLCMHCGLKQMAFDTASNETKN